MYNLAGAGRARKKVRCGGYRHWTHGAQAGDLALSPSSQVTLAKLTVSMPQFLLQIITEELTQGPLGRIK